MTMLESKWVRIMADHCADPLWGPDGTMESLEDLPVTEDLRDRLDAWQQWYDVHSLDDPGFDTAAFSRTGRELAKGVKAQLPDWTIIYFDEAAAAMTAPDRRRETFEYEIGI
jgi:uncharacterized protein YbcC (UPF0753/DUF2309 family)